ncbi:MAG: PAS domain-containing sensor histidine kinase [Chloroflexi bacterium]|nr:PAS domain-containing sensor histidine kinase [Chloroflexota bacterium]
MHVLITRDHDRLLLAASLSLAIGLAWRLRDGPRAEGARDLALSAAGLLGCTAIGLVWAGLAWALQIPHTMWSGPLDRLVGVTSIVTLGWLAGAQRGKGWRGRLLLGGGFAGMLLTYLVWAPRWAMAFSGDLRMLPAQTTVTGINGLWDASQAILALLVGGSILFGTARRSRPALALLGLLTLGSLLDLLQPMDAMHPAWARMGALAGGLALVAGAAAQNLSWERAGGRFAGLRRPRSTASKARPMPSRAEPSRTPSGYGLPEVMTALHSQTSTLGRIADRLDHLGERVDRLEQDAVGRPVDVEASTGSSGPANIAALAARLTQYEAVLGHLPLGILLTDAAGRIGYANASAERLLGHPGGLVDRELSTLIASAESLLSDLTQAERSGKPDWAGAIDIAQPSIHLDLFGLRPAAESSPASRLVVIRPRDPVGRSLAGDLVPDLGEALRAPVNSILGYSQLLRSGSTLAEAQVQRYLERIDANLARMQVMLGNVSTVLQAEHPGSRSSSALDLTALVRQAVERAQPQLDQKGLRAEQTVDPRLASVEGQPEVVAQILDNLLLHAARRSPHGADLRIEIVALPGQPGPRARLTVQDRGPTPGEVGRGQPVEIAVEDAHFALELRMVALLTRLNGGRVRVERHPLGSLVSVDLPEAFGR